MKKISNLFVFVLFFAGVLFGLTLSVLATWADFEANFYGFTKQTSNPLPGLQCPVMMTPHETREVFIKVRNTSDRALSPNVKTQISTPLTLDETFDYIKVPPGETVTLQKTIGAQNIDLGNFIFVNVLVYSAYPMPNQESMCGVFILPFGKSGKTMLIAGTILSLALLGAGVYFLRKIGLKRKILNPLLFIAFLVILTMGFSYLGWWLSAIAAFVVIALMFAIALGGVVIH